MQDPKLSREVELPRSRSNGAAVILVAAMAMFTAVAASAFVVRVRMQRERGAGDRPPAAAARGGALGAPGRRAGCGGPERSEGPPSSPGFAGRGRPLSTGVTADIAAER